MNKMLWPLLTATLVFAACDDNTQMIGMDMMPDGDNITAQGKVYTIDTRTVQVDSVLANTSTCYLGSLIDPELRIKTTCDFLTQFHLPEQFSLPPIDRIVKDESGNIVADSCDIRLYFEEYTGDSLATMKLSVQELSKDRVMEESKAYYSNIDPSVYVKGAEGVNKTLTYSVKDLSRPESETSGSTYYRQIVVKLPQDYGTKLLKDYYEHPEYFANTYQFIHNVCPGFYFQCAGGTGSMVKSKMMALNVYFQYHGQTDEGNDTIVDGMQRFGATEEVIQSTRTDNEYPGSISLEEISRQACTYVKSPAGFFTELTLPVHDIVAGEHYTDSINQAQVTIRKYLSSASSSELPLPAPTYLLLVRKDKMNEFFEQDKLPDGSDAFLSSKFTSSSSAYQFANIAQLITNLRFERDKGAGVKPGDDEATRNALYAEWERKHPDWNKVMLVPVDVATIKSNNYYGQTTETIQRVTHQLGMNSARLEGGMGQPLEMQIIYSRLNRK